MARLVAAASMLIADATVSTVAASTWVKIDRLLLRGGLPEELGITVDASDRELVITVDVRDGKFVVTSTADQDRSAA